MLMQGNRLRSCRCTFTGVSLWNTVSTKINGEFVSRCGTHLVVSSRFSISSFKTFCTEALDTLRMGDSCRVGSLQSSCMPPGSRCLDSLRWQADSFPHGWFLPICSNSLVFWSEFLHCLLVLDGYPSLICQATNEAWFGTLLLCLENRCLTTNASISVSEKWQWWCHSETLFI